MTPRVVKVKLIAAHRLTIGIITTADLLCVFSGITKNDVLRFTLQRKPTLCPYLLLPGSLLTRLTAALRFIVCACDMAFCAAAGAAAASVGARVSGNPATSFVLQTGALGGVIASGTLGFSSFVWKAARAATSTVVVVAATWFGTAFIVALAMCNRVLGESECSSYLPGLLSARARIKELFTRGR